MDGADVLERLRAWSTVPLIVLSVRANEAEKVRLLELGADDYVVKPFGMAELLARAHSAMRRQLRASRGEPVVKFGPLSIDFAARAVFINDQRVTLTPKEYRLLQDPGAAFRQCRHPSIPAARSLGQRTYRRHPLSADLRAQAAPQDRGRSDPAGNPADRTRCRLPAGDVRSAGGGGARRRARSDRERKKGHKRASLGASRAVKGRNKPPAHRPDFRLPDAPIRARRQTPRTTRFRKIWNWWRTT